MILNVDLKSIQYAAIKNKGEKKMPKKVATLLLITLLCLVGLTACTGASAGTSDLTKGKTAEQIAEEAFDKWYGLANYDMSMEIYMKTSVGAEDTEMTMKSDATLFQNPLKMKMTANVTIPMLEPQTMTFEQYMLTENEKMTIYQQVDGVWQKMVIDDSATMELMQMDPKDNLKLFMDSLKKAEILAEEKIEQTNTVKLELVASSEVFGRIMEQTAGNPLGINEGLFGPAILAQIGDLKYTLWIDKATLNVIKGQMNLSENIRNLGAALAAEQDMPAELQEMFSSMEFVVDYTVMNHNNAQDFTVPEEAKRAREIVMNE